MLNCWLFIRFFFYPRFPTRFVSDPLLVDIHHKCEPHEAWWTEQNFMQIQGGNGTCKIRVRGGIIVFQKCWSRSSGANWLLARRRTFNVNLTSIFIISIVKIPGPSLFLIFFYAFFSLSLSPLLSLWSFFHFLHVINHALDFVLSP